MSKNSETGDHVNLTRFNGEISYVKSYGEAYNPSNLLLKLPALEEMSAIAKESLEGVDSVLSVYNKAVAAREIPFSTLSKYVTRIMRMLKSSGVPKHVFDQVNTVARKIKGQRASAIIKPKPPVDGIEPEPTPKQISAAQMSYDRRSDNFGKVVELLAGIPEYNPNEDDLKVESLAIFDADLKAKNKAVVDVQVTLSNARIARNAVLYTDITGLCDIGNAVKDYVLGVYGATSPQYRQISKIKFTKRKV